MSTAVNDKSPPSSARSDIALPSISLPPSPPASTKSTATSRAVLRALQRIQQLESGTATVSDWQEFALSPSEFEEFERRVQLSPRLRAYWNTKFRYNYDGTGTGKLTILMLDAVHEIVIKEVEDAIQAAFRDTADRLERAGQVEAAAELRKVRKSGSTTLEFEAVENSSQESGNEHAPAVIRRSPDASFYHPDAGAFAPSLVLEVSYSQQKKELPYLADSYIVDSRHEVRCVVGLNIAYASRKKTAGKQATLSVWRAAVDEEGVGICEAVVAAVPFRDDDGSVCDGALNLTVADFLPPTTATTLSSTVLGEPINIEFNSLAAFLATAEESKATPRLAPPPKAPTHFRKRKRTPPEELSDSREDAFARAEEEELVRRDKEDPEWSIETCVL